MEVNCSLFSFLFFFFNITFTACLGTMWSSGDNFQYSILLPRGSNSGRQARWQMAFLLAKPSISCAPSILLGIHLPVRVNTEKTKTKKQENPAT